MNTVLEKTEAEDFSDKSRLYFSQLSKGDADVEYDHVKNIATVRVNKEVIGQIIAPKGALDLFNRISEVCKRHGAGGHPKTECCGYVANRTLPYPVMWNEHNKVVQCHNCGRIFSPVQSASEQNHSGASGETWPIESVSPLQE